MGTLFEVLLLGDDEQHLAAVADAVLDEIERIEQLLSRFDPRSEISRINRLAAREPVLIDREVAQLLAACLAAREWTGGAIDIAASSLASQASGMRQLPDDVASSKFAALPKIEFDPVRRLIRFHDSVIQLDLGAIGKGYALDRAAEILSENNIEHALLHGGTSSVLAQGRDENGQPWRIALRDPTTGEPAETIELSDAALSCSAVNEQADIIDPRTGKVVAGEVGYAVMAPTAAEAEVLSTALVVMDREAAERFVLEQVASDIRIVRLAGRIPEAVSFRLLESV
ncbi:MAG: FAD:protein FMN transferase [Pirellulaceae bacterium]|nr:FAD:protein FMN transferase [Pirellulaceae bacterium]